MALWLTLTDAFGFLGFAGTVIALVSALAVVIAVNIGSAENVRIAAHIWPAGALLALCNCYTGNWTFLAVALISLPLALSPAVLIAAHRTPSRRRASAPAASEPGETNVPAGPS